MKSINAEKIIKTINWIANDDNSDSLLEPIKKGGVYVCEICLPLIEKTVIGIGDSKVESIGNAAEQASNLIDEYLANNPNINVENYFDDKIYVLEEDSNGCLSIHVVSNKQLN